MNINKKTARWQTLDNAALIFPSASTKSNTYVFRFVCQLYEDVNPDILEEALRITAPEFPLYSTILKRGAFWYYLEESTQEPVVMEDSLPLCSPLFFKEQKSLLYRITYFRKRINLEVHHVLSDGTGAIEFLKKLVQNYLVKMYPNDFERIPSSDYDASVSERGSDGFERYYDKNSNNKKRKSKEPNAYQLHGEHNPEDMLSVVEGVMPAAEIIKAAHKYNATVTVFLTAVLLKSIGDEMSINARRFPAVLNVPVNLRQFFPSKSARNFFSIIRVGHKFRKDKSDTLEEIIDEVKLLFTDNLKQDELENRLNKLSSFERNIIARISPLIIKDIVLYLAYRSAGRKNTAVFSNVGKIQTADELYKYIDRFSVFTSTNKLQACMVTYNDKMSIAFTSEYVSRDIQKNFFRYLTDLGIPVSIWANRIGE